MKLNISEALALPPDTVTSTLVIYGGKGMGKTNLGAVIVEELARQHLHWAVLDPLGVWWGLRHSRDGKGPGIECLILGGAHGDIAIEPTAGAVCADLVVEEAANVIVDFSRAPSGRVWSIGEKIRFVTEYAVRLFERQGELIGGRRRPPMIQILDEAARYIPQSYPAGALDLARCAAAWNQIVEEGRNFGLGVGLITQRSARMAKSVSELADVMFAFRTIGPNSIDAIIDWLGEHVPKERWKSMIEQLRMLPRGSALVVSPGWLQFEGIVPIRMRETFDSSATPGHGEAMSEPRGGAKPDLDQYRARMAATIERAKADNPAALRAEIVQLKKQLAAKESASAGLDRAAAEKMVHEALLQGIKVERAKWYQRLLRAKDDVGVVFEWVDENLTFAAEDSGAGSSFSPSNESAKHEPPREFHHRDGSRGGAPVRREPIVDQSATRREPIAGSSALPVGERRVLTAIAQAIDGADREMLTVLTDYKRSSRDTYIQRLREKGLIEVSGNDLRATEGGIAALGADFSPLPTGGALRELWLGRLPSGERTLLEAIVKEHPEIVSRDFLSECTGYKRSSRDTYIQRLHARRLIEITRDGVCASAMLFDS